MRCAGVIASVTNRNRSAQSPAWWMASVTGRAPRSSVAAWYAIQSAGTIEAPKATIFTGDQRPDRSRRNGIAQARSSEGAEHTGRLDNAQSNDARGRFIADHDFKSPVAQGARGDRRRAFLHDGGHPWATAQSIGRSGRGGPQTRRALPPGNPAGCRP